MSEITLDMEQAETKLRDALVLQNFPEPAFASHAAIWLQACGYAGLQTLQEAITDQPTGFELKRTAIGIDLQNISCARIGEIVVADIQKHGRVFLRNVRHGLFLLSSSVEQNFGIGCPVDPSFALGGERGKNPYVAKLELAKAQGIAVNAELWQNIIGAK